MFTESNRKPGDTGFKCITVNSGGSLAGNLRLYRGAITGTNDAALAAVIDVTVDAVVAAPRRQRPGQLHRVHRWGTGGGTFSGTLSSMPTTYAAAAGVAVVGGTQRIVYRIGWTINSAADNTVQSSSAVANLNWEIN